MCQAMAIKALEIRVTTKFWKIEMIIVMYPSRETNQVSLLTKFVIFL